MFAAMVLCTANHTNVLHYKNIWMKKFEHEIDENTTTKHFIDIKFIYITTLHVFMPGISIVMIEFIDWN